MPGVFYIVGPHPDISYWFEGAIVLVYLFYDSQVLNSANQASNEFPGL